jgi:hypothetical protein
MFQDNVIIQQVITLNVQDSSIIQPDENTECSVQCYYPATFSQLLTIMLILVRLVTLWLQLVLSSIG